MIGSGATQGAVARQRDALGLTEAIEIVPFMAQDRLWETMRRSDLLCHPCDYEGVSKIILEAMMLGLPVLASDVAPLPDYVIEGETGFRAANTPEAWAERLLWIAANKALLPARLRPGARLRGGALRRGAQPGALRGPLCRAGRLTRTPGRVAR